jgi:hypothetical protein
MSVYGGRRAKTKKDSACEASMKNALATSVTIVVAAGALWAGSVQIEDQFLPGASHGGYDLASLAAGVRLLLLLVGGVWAAVGISLSSLAMLIARNGEGASGTAVLLSLMAGFGPYVSLVATSNILGIDKNLSNLSPLHLPLISLGVAAGSATLHAATLWWSGSQSLSHVTGLALAMASVDFLGCLITIFLLTLGLGTYRQWQRRGP